MILFELTDEPPSPVGHVRRLDLVDDRLGGRVGPGHRPQWSGLRRSGSDGHEWGIRVVDPSVRRPDGGEPEAPLTDSVGLIGDSEHSRSLEHVEGLLERVHMGSNAATGIETCERHLEMNGPIITADHCYTCAAGSGFT